MKFAHTLTTGTALAMAAVILASCSSETPTQESVTDRSEGPIARVNGEDIPRDEYDFNVAQAVQMAMLQGQDLSEDMVFQQQILDSIIATVLIRQDAERSNVGVSDADVETEYQGIITQVGGEEEFAVQLVQSGMTEADLRQNIRNQLMIQKHLEEQLQGEDLEVTEAETRALYEEILLQQDDLPPYEELEEPLKEQVRQDKEQQIIDALIAKLRESAEIEMYL